MQDGRIAGVSRVTAMPMRSSMYGLDPKHRWTSSQPRWSNGPARRQLVEPLPCTTGTRLKPWWCDKGEDEQSFRDTETETRSPEGEVRVQGEHHSGFSILASTVGGLLLLSLAACGIPGAAPVSSSPASHASPRTSSQSSVSSPTPSSSPASGSPAPGRCLSANLSVQLVQTQGAAGSVVRTYAFTNEGPAPCTLFGYPGFGLLGSSGQSLSTTVVRTPGPQSTVTLVSGGHAWFTLQYPDQTGYGSLTCPTSTALEVTPPNAYHFLTVTGTAGTIQAYGGTSTHLQCGRLSVRAVTGTPPSP